MVGVQIFKNDSGKKKVLELEWLERRSHKQKSGGEISMISLISC
jgi:hypothetical protein